MVSLLKLDLNVSKVFFKTPVLLCAAEHTVLSRMNHIVQSMGLRSKLKNGYMFLSQNSIR